MSKVIRLTSKTGLVKEVSFGAKVKLEGQFHGAKIELIDAKTGLKVAKAKVRIDGDDVVVSFVEVASYKGWRVIFGNCICYV